jgi:hypothetical protein
MKAFIAHLLLNYDIALNPEIPSYKSIWLSYALVQDPKASILVRKRRTN